MADDKPIEQASAGKPAPESPSQVIIPLPTDRPRSIAPTFSDQKKSASLPARLTGRLSEVALSLDTTFFVATCAAFFALLQRYSGLHHLVVGIPASSQVLARYLLAHHANLGGAHHEAQRVMVLVANTLALRVRCRPTETFRDLVASVRQAIGGGTARGLETSEPELKPTLSSSQAGAFQVMFHCLPTGASPAKTSLTETRLVAEPTNTSTELSLALSEHEGRWLATVHYSAKLFDEHTIDRLLHHYIQLLDEFGNDATRPIGSVDMLTNGERQQILRDWNLTQREYPREVCLHELFEARAQFAPQRIALVSEDGTLTYGELNRRATQLAHHLQLRGVGPGSLVGICVSRSVHLAVGVLGILKAGGAYVPIDPSHPTDRNAFVLEDAACRIVLTEKALQFSFSSATASSMLIDELPALESSERPYIVPAVHSRNLAYVLYTSGSTGKPKGVQIEHRSVVNFLESMRREPGLTEDDVVLAVTTLSFDIAGLELHLPLTTGAQIVLASKDVVVDGVALLQKIEQHQVTFLQATPATWRLMLAAGWQGTPRLKVLCGGEAMPANLASALLPRCAELWNMYGPTETTIWSTCGRITDPNNIHIGRPIDNTEIYILNASHQPLPVGHVGELLIGGAGLARGYLHRPELTADRFIPHPFKPNAFVFRTGDLARYRADGNIDCLGRMDFQVKIRGFRIELGEIENQLANHPQVRQSVVVAREDTSGDPRLIAYLILRAEAAVSEGQLREHLRSKLPDYMIPETYCFLRTFPLTPNGKIDRKALPGRMVEAIEAKGEAPSNPTELRVKEVFERILGRPIGSRHDSFFELGGHSLLAAELMNAVELEFGQKLPLAKLLQSPSVASFAALLDEATTASTGWNSLVPIRPVPGAPTLFLVHGAGGNVLLYRELAQALGPEISVYGFQAQGLDGNTPPLATVEEMAERYLGELKAFQTKGPYHLAGYCMGGTIAFEMARILHSQGERTGLVGLLDTYNFSLAKTRSSYSFLRQKVGFHLENLAAMRAKDLVGYVGEKLRMAREAGAGRIGAQVKALKNPKTTSVRQKSFLQEINDKAAFLYTPPSFAGAVTVFRPQKQYDFMPDPRLGWGEVVSGRLEVVPLPINPHAMLINPFAQRLGQELKAKVLSATS